MRVVDSEVVLEEDDDLGERKETKRIG